MDPILDAAGQFAGAVHIVRDITERKRVEEALRENEESFRAVTENANDGIVIAASDGTHLYANERASEITGYSIEELLKIGMKGLAHPDEIPKLSERLKKRIAAEEIPRQYETSIIHRQGKVVLVEISASRGFWHGQIADIVIFRDITERKRVEETLRESEDRYRDLVEYSHDLLCTHDLEGKLLSVNPAVLRIGGYSKDELLGMNFGDFLAPEVRGQFGNYLTEIQAKGAASGVMLVQTKDGEKRLWEYHNTLRTEGVAAPIVRGMARDITERKHAEEALRESEKRFRELFDNAPVGYFEYDSHGRITSINRTELEMLGYALEEMTGQPVWKFIVKEEEARQQILGKLAGTMPPARGFERTYRRKDGTTFPALVEDRLLKDEKGRIRGIRATIQDITERKQAEELLRASETKYRKLHESITDGFAYVDMQGVIRDCNESYQRMLGYSFEELARLTYVDLTPEKWHAYEERIVKEQILPRNYSEVYEKEYRKKDGTIFPVELRTFLIRDNAGQPAGMWAIIRDITERKRMEQSLQQSEERYRTLVEESFDGIFIQKGPKVIFVNRRLSEMLGYDKSEIEGMDHWLLYHLDYQELTRERAKARMRGEAVPSQYEVKLQRKDGSTFDGEVLAREIMLVDEPGVQVWVRDITERKRIEELLKESEVKYRSIVETTAEWIWEMDLNGRHTFSNPAVTAILGYRPEEIIGQTAISLLHAEDRSEVETILPRLMAEKRGWKGWILRWLHKDGSYCFLESNAEPILDSTGQVRGYRGTDRDITERKRAEEALVASEERFRELFDGAPVGYHEIDKEGKIVRVNRTELDMLGYTAEEMVGRYVYEFIAGEMSPQSVKGKLAGERPVESGFERTYLRKGGTTIPVLIEETLIKDIEGRIVGIRSTIQDITERKRSDEEKATLQDQLRQSQKIEAIGRLSGGIAHDFNNILTIISGNAQLSLLDHKQGDPLRENIEEIKRASERAADLTRQLLAFSRKQVMEMRVLDLNHVVQGLDKMLHRLLGEDIELRTVLPEGIGKVKADPGQIEQVIVNLAVNARDAMIEGGKLTIETAGVELDEKYAHKHIAVQPGRYVMLSVSDTGEGMTSEVKERVFEPFFTTKEQGKGTGLGLSTVYGIVKQSGGNIWIYSEPGQGTTFKIYLPQVDEPLTEEKEEVVKEIPRGNETILVVEDEETVRKLAVRSLKSLGYRVLDAPEGGMALLVCEEFKGRIHLILTDVVMPGMGGRKLAERLKQIHPEMKVLFMSGYTDNAIVHHGVLEEGTKFIQKPFTLENLARKVREALDK